jgi:hypothetical protein
MPDCQEVKAGLPASLAVLEGKSGDSLTLSVDVNDMQFPYSVVFESRTIIFGFVDRSETLPDLQPGTYVVSWAFSHRSKGWKHELTARLGQGAAKVLDSRSEENRDNPFAAGSAVICIQ